MRYSDRDKAAFKIYRNDTDRIYPTRTRGSNVARYILINKPEEDDAEYMIVPGEKAYRKNGYWLNLSFKGGQFNGGFVYRVRNFLPIGEWLVMRQGKTIFEQVDNAWAEYKDLSAAGQEYNFTDVKMEQLLKRGQEEWLDFLRMRDACIVHLTNMSIEYIDNDVDFSSKIGMCITKFENACDEYEKKRFGGIEFKDPCPMREYERFQ